MTKRIAATFLCVAGSAVLLFADPSDLTLFVTPRDGHQPVIDAISDPSAAKIDMTMFHLSDPDVVNALAAKGATAQVRVILDGSGLKSNQQFADVANQLRAAGVQVSSSTPAFSITHEKALVINGSKALIMTMNMTLRAPVTRDYGIITEDPGIVSEIESVFETDLQNAQTLQGITPPLSNPNLVWSPVNSQARLSALAASASSELIATVENLGDPVIQSSMLQAAQNGATVRIVVPMCDINWNPLYNFPFLKQLAAGGVQTRVMPYPNTATQPYMHAKMMIADGKQGYIGSVNYSQNSTLHARELGILFTQADIIAQIKDIFETDWNNAIPAPDPPPTTCPTSIGVLDSPVPAAGN